MAEQTVDIADDSAGDTYLDSDGQVRVDHEVVARSRLRVDTRRWLVSKMLPKIYGDKQQIETSITINQQTDEQIDQRIKELISKTAALPGPDTQ